MQIKLTFVDGSNEVITLEDDFAVHSIGSQPHLFLSYIMNAGVQYFFDTNGDVTLRKPSKTI